MKKMLHTIWMSRTPRDRKIISLLLVVVLMMAYGEFVYLTQQSTQLLRARLITLRAQAVQMDEQALEFARVSRLPTLTASPTDLQSLLQLRVHSSGLSSALQSLDSVNNNQVVMTLGAVNFVDWLNWITDLQAQHIRVEACRIEALSSPGLVSVTATFVRTPAP